MINNIKPEYDARCARMKDVLNNRKPDNVPVVLNAQSWVMNYAGISVRKAFLEDSDALFQAYQKYLADVYNDALMDVSNTMPMNMATLLGEGLYVISDECVQIVGGRGEIMSSEEYPEFTKNPNDFIANVLTPRKFPIFTQVFEKNVELLKNLYAAFVSWNRHNAEAVSRIEKEVGVPLFVNGSNYNPMDSILDYFRDFVGITKDIKRIPEILFKACESLYSYIIEMFNDTAPPALDDKLLFSPLHIPTYLNRRDFEKTYYPFMKKYVEEVNVKRGYAMYFFMENDWMPYIDFLQDLPKEARLVLLFEHGDLRKIKEKIGADFTIMGGMPISLLNYGSKQDCLDKVKECIDTLAPNGNYIFSFDKILMSLNEAKPENVIETAQFAHEYGKY